MKIVDIAVKKVYRFNCPNCQSRLEADSSELTEEDRLRGFARITVSFMEK